MKTVIMAGGRGTRISSVASDIPKPMIKIEGKPVLEHELECLRDQGFTDIILTVSHLGNIIMDYFGDGSGVSPATGSLSEFILNTILRRSRWVMPVHFSKSRTSWIRTSFC